jgi:hypothetical protein
VNLEAFVFDSTYYPSLKNMDVEIWALELSSFVMWWRMSVDDVTWVRVLTTTTIMTMRPLPNYNQQDMIYQTKIQQMCESVSMLDEFY